MAKSKNYLISETANNLLNTDSLDDALKKDPVLEPVYDGLNRQQGQNNFNIHYNTERTTEIDTAADAIVAAHKGAALIAPDLVDVHASPPFANKKILVGNEEKSLFKRVHGVRTVSIPAGTTGYLELVVPYATAKFAGAEIFGVDHLDTLDFFILDTDTNTYSGAPIEYPNWLLNQFGFDVEMPPGGAYKNTSNYDADVYQSMIISCAYKNNGSEAKIITGNYWLHEVK